MLREFQAKLIPLEEQVRTKIDCDIFDEEIDKLNKILLNQSSLMEDDEKKARMLKMMSSENQGPKVKAADQ